MPARRTRRSKLATRDALELANIKAVGLDWLSKRPICMRQSRGQPLHRLRPVTGRIHSVCTCARVCMSKRVWVPATEVGLQASWACMPRPATGETRGWASPAQTECLRPGTGAIHTVYIHIFFTKSLSPWSAREGNRIGPLVLSVVVQVLFSLWPATYICTVGMCAHWEQRLSFATGCTQGQQPRLHDTPNTKHCQKYENKEIQSFKSHWYDRQRPQRSVCQFKVSLP